MAETKGKKVRFIYGLCFTALTLVVGALFIVQVLSIYRSSSSSPYTVERISAHFSQIAIPVWLWVAALVGNIVLGFVFPETEKEDPPKAEVSTDVKLARLQARLPQNAVGMSAINKQRNLRTLLGICCAVTLIAVAAVCLSYLLDENYIPLIGAEFFPGSRALADRLVRCLPWIVGGFAVSIVLALISENSKQQELSLTKTSIVESAKQGIKAEKKAAPSLETTERQSDTPNLNFFQKILEFFKKIGAFLDSEKGVLVQRIVFGVLGVVFVVWGICNGGMADMFKKAINICTQCIGLG